MIKQYIEHEFGQAGIIIIFRILSGIALLLDDPLSQQLPNGDTNMRWPSQKEV
jgi:hypothetical protein